VQEPAAVLDFGDFRLDGPARCVWNRSTGERLALSPRAFDLLALLVTRVDQLVSKQEIMQTVWANVVVEDNNLDQIISTLRQALGEQRGDYRYIQTVHRRGYRFIMPVLPAAPAAPEQSHRRDAPAELRNWTRARAALAAGAVAVAIAAVVLAPGGRHTDSTSTAPPPPATAPRSIAVLPFRPLIGADRNESLEVGVTESLITALQDRGLRVQPLGVVRRFTADDRDVRAIGRQLGVDAVLDGHLQRDGDQLRVAAKLIRVADGSQLWADRYDERFAGVFAIQDAIAGKVGAALAPAKAGADASAPLRPPLTRDAEAYNLYLIARYHREQRVNVAGLRQALDLYHQLAERDPKFAAAHVGIAEIRTILGVFGAVAPRDTYPQALEAVHRALAIEPDSATALAALGHILTQYEYDWPGAETAYRRSLGLDPQIAATHQFYGLWLAYADRFDEALREMRTAAALEPTVPTYRALIGMLLNYQRRYDEALVELQAALAMDARHSTTHTFMAMGLMRLRRFDDALAHLDAAQSLAPGSQGYRGQIYALNGEPAKARQEIRRLQALSREQYVSAYDIAAIHAALGDRDEAMSWLQRGYEERSQVIGFVRFDPAFDALRDDPRYHAVLRHLNQPRS
jgi:TolB-like protein/DNA-binding winged helix-turn-helix (wHTH) protein/Tfp pilus assembly protein PilF